eukprot:1150170-Pelagomonas_calceolata.AAC.10
MRSVQYTHKTATIRRPIENRIPLAARFWSRSRKEKKDFFMIGSDNTTPTLIKGKRTPETEASCVPSTKGRKKRKGSMGIRRVISSTPCQILVC